MQDTEGLGPDFDQASPDQVREYQARCLWNLGFGSQRGCRSFQDYLALVPKIPDELLERYSDFPYISLCDPCSLNDFCELIEISYSFVGAYDEQHQLPKRPFWFRHDDGMNPGNLSGHRVMASEALFAVLHHPEFMQANDPGIFFSETLVLSPEFNLRHPVLELVDGDHLALSLVNEAEVGDRGFKFMRARRMPRHYTTSRAIN